MYINVHNSIMHISHKGEDNGSINKWMDRQTGAYVEEDTIQPLKGIQFWYILHQWLNLENIILSEISHIQKDKCMIFTYMRFLK